MKSNEISLRGFAVRARALHVAAGVVTALILWGTLWPNLQTPIADLPYADKLWHVLAFAAWAGVIAAGWRLPAWAVIAGIALAGAAIELIQPLTGRTAELADWAADLSGAALGVWGARWLLPRCLAGLPPTPPPTGFFGIAQALQRDGFLARKLDHQLQRPAHCTNIAGQGREQEVALTLVFGDGSLLDTERRG